MFTSALRNADAEMLSDTPTDSAEGGEVEMGVDSGEDEANDTPFSGTSEGVVCLALGARAVVFDPFEYRADGVEEDATKPGSTDSVEEAVGATGVETGETESWPKNAIMKTPEMNAASMASEDVRRDM